MPSSDRITCWYHSWCFQPPFSVPDVCEGVNGGVVFDHSSGSVGLRTENYCIQFFSLLDNLEASQVCYPGCILSIVSSKILLRYWCLIWFFDFLKLMDLKRVINSFFFFDAGSSVWKKSSTCWWCHGKHTNSVIWHLDSISTMKRLIMYSDKINSSSFKNKIYQFWLIVEITNVIHVGWLFISAVFMLFMMDFAQENLRSVTRS